MEVTTNDAKIRPVNRPQSEPILVALDQLRRCPDKVAVDFWPRKETKIELAVRLIKHVVVKECFKVKNQDNS